MRAALAGLALLGLASVPAAAQPQQQERDWGETLRSDARALYGEVSANHPGPVNTEDPGFAATNDAQLALALDRAKTADSYGDYFFALRQYVASFDDGHFSFGAFGATPNDFRWPGFLTTYRSDGAIKVALSEQAEVPLGAELLSCDGMSAQDYAASTLGRMWGRWELESQRQAWGEMLFVDESSGYVPIAATCRLSIAGETREVSLEWRAIDIPTLTAHLQAITPPRASEFSVRALADGTRWFSFPSFDSDPASQAGQALTGIIAAMRVARDQLLQAPTIVLDLRGNGGGSSDWSAQIARVLWGGAAVAELPSRATAVDWRASQANLDTIVVFSRNVGGSETTSPQMRRWIETVIAGLTGAIARGDALWRQPEDPQDRRSSDAPAIGAAPFVPPVYLVTDSRCASACLDAVDLWKALGAIHVGRTTSADTLYMEGRFYRLPSGLAGGTMPMKVYRGRARGSNEPVVPAHLFPGDIADTAALEAFIAGLREDN